MLQTNCILRILYWHQVLRFSHFALHLSSSYPQSLGTAYYILRIEHNVW